MNGQDRTAGHAPGPPGGDTMLLEASPLNVPLNLCQWVSPDLIAEWIKMEVERLDHTKSEVREAMAAKVECHPEVLLSVLVFAYATQLYVSEEITSACHQDPVLRSLCRGKVPFAEELTHFRRTHRLLVENVLAQLLIRAVREKFVELGELPAGLQHSLFGRAARRLDTARHMDTAGE